MTTNKTIVGVLVCLFSVIATASGRETPSSNQILEQLQRQPTSVLFWNRAQRRVGFSNMEKILPTRRVLAGAENYRLAPAPVEIAGLSYELNGEEYLVSEFMAREDTLGIIVVRGHDILFEHYAEDHDKDSRWISFSVTKSVTSMLIGAAIQDGFILSVDEPVVHYLPRLRGTGYEQTTIKDVLQMASGVAWNEDYQDPNSDVARAGGSNGLQLVSYLAALPYDEVPGEKFNYNTGETNLVGEVLRAAIGNNAATYLTHKIWQPFGMGADAYWNLGEPGGGELGGCCLNATLRDYARLGLFALADGVLPDGDRVLPPGWIQESTSASKGAEGYGYLWWLYDQGFAAMGIFGQFIRIFPEQNLVFAMHSNASVAVDPEFDEHQEAVANAIRAHVTR